MSIGRKEALRRIRGLAVRIEEHLAMLAENRISIDASHWRHEVDNWITQIEADLSSVGRRTATTWRVRIVEWRRQLEEYDNAQDNRS